MMNDLQMAQAVLSAAMLRDPALALANVVAWLDPHQIQRQSLDEDDVQYDAADEADYLDHALAICRHCFPEVYTEASQLIWQGADYDVLNRQICAGINRHLAAPLGDLEMVDYGPPIDGMGVPLDEPDFYEFNPDLASVLADFGINEATFDTDFRFAQSIAVALLDSLKDRTEQTYADLVCLLGWLFCATGNTLVDLTNNDIWENGIEPPEWTLDDIAFVNDMTLEAIGIVASAKDAGQTLQEDEKLRRALRRNIQILVQQHDPNREEDSHVRIDRLRWPDRP